MAHIYKTALFIFRRDLRLHDNTALIAALKEAERVICCFIFDPRQTEEKNQYRSMNSLQFMTESLQDLQQQLAEKEGHLYLFCGQAHDVLKDLLAQEKIDAVFSNKDYTPFSIKRDAALEKICTQQNVAWRQCDDIMLNAPESVLTGNGTPYGKFTPYFKKCSLIPVARPANLPAGTFVAKKITGDQPKKIFSTIAPEENKEIKVHGGRAHSAKILKNLARFKNYEEERNFPELDSTNLSAYIKFGTHSIREVYWALCETLGKHHPLIAQLYWHDFYTQASFHTPSVFGNAFVEKYNDLPWNNSAHDFNAWCNGTTGFPIVDAGMRELNATGFMHNRVRMIVASFLTKDLHINWQKGEKYFAQKLVDYDPCVNNGNWQWAASTGYDAQPYFRIFNPWLQQAKFDPECVYIKKWVPELQNYSPKTIHTLFKNSLPVVKGYPRPMVDHTIESKKAILVYKQA